MTTLSDVLPVLADRNASPAARAEVAAAAIRNYVEHNPGDASPLAWHRAFGSVRVLVGRCGG